MRGERGARRSRIALHYELLGLLLAAGEDGMALSEIGKFLFPDYNNKRAIWSARNLVCAAGSAVPICEGDNGRIGLYWPQLAHALRGYGIPVAYDFVPVSPASAARRRSVGS